MTRETLIDLIEEAMDAVHDMDVTFRQYAEAAADKVLARIEALQAENERLREALDPFDAALSIAKAVLGPMADRGHLEAVALRYVSLDILKAASAALAGEGGQ